MSPSWSTITSLDLSHSASEINDISIITLSQNCPSLATLDIAHCYNITDEAILALSEGCKLLTTLFLSANDLIQIVLSWIFVKLVPR